MTMLTLPPNPKSVNHEGQYANLQQLKLSFISNGKAFFAVIVRLLADALSRKGKCVSQHYLLRLLFKMPQYIFTIIVRERKRRDVDMIELLLTLLKNLLAIPDAQPTQNAAVAPLTKLQDDLIILLDECKVLKLLIILAQQIDEPENRTYGVLLLEILFYLFKREEPSELSQSAALILGKKGENPQQAVGASIKSIVVGNALSALLQKKELTPANMSVRHPRFGGSFLLTAEVQHHVMQFLTCCSCLQYLLIGRRAKSSPRQDRISS